jgi:N-glycosylase/DNA lyase
MLTHKKLKAHHAVHQQEIKNRLKEFATHGRKMNEKHLFIELCFCLCTPQSKALKVAQVINVDNTEKLLKLPHVRLAELLRRNVRFHNNKASHIIAARGFISEIASLNKDSMVAREYIVKNIKGLGYKEASHFLRNIGYRNLCIVDRHVVSLMHELNVFETSAMPSTPKKYLEMEERIKKYAKKIRIDVDELDLALWSIKTGHVFR